MGVVDGTPSPGPPTWVLEPHLDISVGDILAVQELDGSANITHDLCSFCRHSRRVRDASQRSGSRALTLLSPGTAQNGEGTLATQDPHSIPYPSHSNFPWGCPSPPGPLCPGLGYLSPGQLQVGTRAWRPPSQDPREPISNKALQTHRSPWGRHPLSHPLLFSWGDRGTERSKVLPSITQQFYVIHRSPNPPHWSSCTHVPLSVKAWSPRS